MIGVDVTSRDGGCVTCGLGPPQQAPFIGVDVVLEITCNELLVDELGRSIGSIHLATCDRSLTVCEPPLA